MADGRELSDRWEEALVMREKVEGNWRGPERERVFGMIRFALIAVVG